jgi:hypothetical protein
VSSSVIATARSATGTMRSRRGERPRRTAARPAD